eukprot:TRINITY_DN736_c0_g2_i1.p1 TRINITY_DN736_c0_g2~~TRINITY_DN736_c0_g2_i1.p1  ORF type:complete len:790 (-),score=67.26 TRINITY_DN736_c0_g2_i1:314-2437(-)
MPCCRCCAVKGSPVNEAVKQIQIYETNNNNNDNGDKDGDVVHDIVVPREEGMFRERVFKRRGPKESAADFYEGNFVDSYGPQVFELDVEERNSTIEHQQDRDQPSRVWQMIISRSNIDIRTIETQTKEFLKPNTSRIGLQPHWSQRTIRTQDQQPLALNLLQYYGILPLSHNQQTTVKQCLEILTQTDNKFVVETHAVIADCMYAAVVTKPQAYNLEMYFKNDDLCRNMIWKYKFKLSIFLEIALAVQYVEKFYEEHADICGEFFMDLHPESIVIDKQFNIKLINFTLNHFLLQTYNVNPPKATDAFIAPELFLQIPEQDSHKAAVFSLGMILYSIVTGQIPYQDEAYPAMKTGLGNRPDIPKGTSQKVAALVEACWRRSPSERPTISEVISAVKDAIKEEDELLQEEYRSLANQEYFNNYFPMIVPATIDLFDINRDVHPSIKFARSIGKGKYGIVYYTTYYSKQAVVKHLNFNYQKQQELLIECDYAEQMDYYCHFQHDHLVKYTAVSIIPGRRAILMEYVSHSLYDYIFYPERQAPPRYSNVIKTIKGIAKALAYLHSKDVIHRDFHTRNVLLTSDGVIKVSDYGIAQATYHFKTEGANSTHTMAYTAPEIILMNKLTRKSDIYSFAIVMFELVTQTHAWNDYPPGKIIKNVSEGKRPALPESVSKELRTLITKSWDQDPNQRPEASHIICTCQKIQTRLNNRK